MRELLPRTGNYSLMATACVSAGEAVEIENCLERVDLNEFITHGAAGVYLIEAVGDSMEAEIFHGDLLVVNRNLQARHGDKVMASVNGLFTVKIFSNQTNGLRLVASNGKYAPRKIHRKDIFEIFGVVTHIIRQIKKI